MQQADSAEHLRVELVVWEEELWANATEVSASPRAVIGSEAGMFIGDTSAGNKASVVPFIETTQVLQSQPFLGVRDTDSIFTLSAIPSAYVRIAYGVHSISPRL